MNPPYAGLERKAEFKDEKEKREEFGPYAWIGARDTSLLDYERCEVLLVGTTADVRGGRPGRLCCDDSVSRVIIKIESFRA